MLMLDIGKRIKARREELGLKTEAVAQAIGKDRSTFYRYENGDIEKMPISILNSLAEVLNTSVGYLLGIEETHTSDKQQVLELILRLHTDETFLDLAGRIAELDPDQLSALKQMISVFQK